LPGKEIIIKGNLNRPHLTGMSDLLSPILAVMGGDEGQAYVSFCALMQRLKINFTPDGAAMTKKFEHLTQVSMKTQSSVR